MISQQFSCPHCGSALEVDLSIGVQQVACPHCAGLMQLPESAHRPPEPPPAAPPVAAAVETHDEAEAPREMHPPSSAARVQQSVSGARDAHAGNKAMKNLILWVLCAIVLVVVLWLLLIQGRG